MRLSWTWVPFGCALSGGTPLAMTTCYAPGCHCWRSGATVHAVDCLMRCEGRGGVRWIRSASRSSVERVLQADAAEILGARDRARTIHRTRDIDAAGAEVEQTVREVLRRKLPAAYYVGHGHIVDEQLTTSSQMDVVIADSARPSCSVPPMGPSISPSSRCFSLQTPCLLTSYLRRTAPGRGPGAKAHSPL